MTSVTHSAQALVLRGRLRCASDSLIPLPAGITFNFSGLSASGGFIHIRNLIMEEKPIFCDLEQVLDEN
jgi:hypothetical protein